MGVKELWRYQECEELSTGDGIGRYRAQVGQPVSLETRPPQLARRLGWHRHIVGGIQPQAGQKGDSRSHCWQAASRRRAA